MKNTVKDRKRGIQWGVRGQLEDLDFADDLAIMSHSHKQLQDKTNRLILFAKQVGLIINASKTEEMNIIEEPQIPININGENLKQVKKFTYLGSVIHSEEGAKADITNRINKARNAFMSLINIWKSKQYSLKTKIKLYNSNVKSVLLYGSECWRVVKNEMALLNSFHNTCLRRISKIFWPNKISNNDLYRKTGCQNIEIEIQIKRLNWIGHVLRMETSRSAKKCLRWNPPGKRKRGRPKTTWRRSVEAELKDMGLTWGEAESLAKDRPAWRLRVAVFSNKRDADK